MRRLLLVLVLLVVPVGASPPTTFTLSIVGTNDLHGGFLPREGKGGLPLLGGYLKNLRAARSRDGGAVLLVDAGDMFQGTLESNTGEGAVVVDAYNALGYAAAAVGNHEFDFGPVGPRAIPQDAADDPRGALKARAAQAKFPFLAANIVVTATGRPLDWPNIKPSVMVDEGGVKVGIIGVATKEALVTTIGPNVRDLSMKPLVDAIVAEATSLRARGARIVVVLAHAGARCTAFDQPADLTSCDTTQEIFGVARALPPSLVDLIVAGHIHQGMAHMVSGIPIIESYWSGRAFGRVDLTIDRTGGRIVDEKIFPPHDIVVGESYEGRPVAPDQTIARVLGPAIRQVATLKAQPMGIVLETSIARDETKDKESPLGNLVADAFRASTPGADVAVNNTFGGIRRALPAGPLVFGSLFEAIPFDNRIVRLRLTGAEVRRIVENYLTTERNTFGISGIRVRAACQGAQIVVTVLRDSGRQVQDDEPLSVTTSDFLAGGGDRIFTPVTPPGGFTYEGGGPLTRDVAADWLRAHGGSLRSEQLVDAANPRWVYPGKVPVTCSP